MIDINLVIFHPCPFPLLARQRRQGCVCRSGLLSTPKRAFLGLVRDVLGRLVRAPLTVNRPSDGSRREPIWEGRDAGWLERRCVDAVAFLEARLVAWEVVD